MSDPIVCPFALGGINYKNGFVTSCPQQSDQLHLMNSGVIRPSEIINNDKFKTHRKELMSGVWSKGCHLCQEAESIGSASMRQTYGLSNSTANYKESGEIDFAAYNTSS